MKTIDSMTLDQQIERLVRQRNALWKLIDKFSFSLEDQEEGGPAARLYNQARKIVGNTYVVEGVNPATGDTLPAHEMPKISGPYVRAAGKSWL